jgi:uncharacterized membrane protein YdjX (TVP38/TMEM64 family)
MDRLKRWIPLISIAILFFCFFYFHLYQYLTFAALKQHREFLLHWTMQYPVLSVLIYMGVYILAVAISVPGAAFLTLAGGFLFGAILGTVYVVISATLGATLIFLATQIALRDWLAQRMRGWVKKMKDEFSKNAFSYLMVLRLVPLFPFWVVNIVPALLGVRLSTFMLATFLGIIPGSFVYVTLGNGLGSLFDTNQTPNLSIIFTPKILLPLLALAALSLVPLIYQHLKGTKK